MAFAAACAAKNLPLRMTSRKRSYSASSSSRNGLWREDAGIVEERVEATKPVYRRLHHRFAGRRQSDVACVHGDTLARRVNLFRGRLDFGKVAAIDDDRATFATKRVATALPIPEAPPVTIATLSWKRITISCSSIYLSVDR